MGFIWTIVLGLVMGLIAKVIHPGKENMGIFMTILLGIAGSFLAGIIGQFIGALPRLWPRFTCPGCVWPGCICPCIICIVPCMPCIICIMACI